MIDPLILKVAIGLALLGLVLIGGWGFTTRWTAEACCARCRYSVAGLPGDVCPECGLKLANEGTLQPGKRYICRPPKLVMLICRTVLIGALVFLLARAEVTGRARTVSEATAVARSEHGFFTELRIEGYGASVPLWWMGERRTARNARDRTTAVLEGPGASLRLRARDVAGRVMYEVGPGEWVRTPDAMTESDALAWMRGAGAEVDHSTALDEAKGIAALIRHIIAGGGSFRGVGVMPADIRALRSVGVTTSSVASFRAWVCILIVLAGVLAWVIVMRRFFAVSAASAGNDSAGLGTSEAFDP